MCVYAAEFPRRLLTFPSPQILAISALPSLFPVSVVLIVSLSLCHRRIPRIHLVHLVVHPVRTECHFEGDWHGWLIGSSMRVCLGMSGLGYDDDETHTYIACLVIISTLLWHLCNDDALQGSVRC